MDCSHIKHALLPFLDGWSVLSSNSPQSLLDKHHAKTIIYTAINMIALSSYCFYRKYFFPDFFIIIILYSNHVFEE